MLSLLMDLDLNILRVMAYVQVSDVLLKTQMNQLVMHRFNKCFRVIHINVQFVCTRISQEPK